MLSLRIRCNYSLDTSLVSDFSDLPCSLCPDTPVFQGVYWQHTRLIFVFSRPSTRSTALPQGWLLSTTVWMSCAAINFTCYKITRRTGETLLIQYRFYAWIYLLLLMSKCCCSTHSRITCLLCLVSYLSVTVVAYHCIKVIHPKRRRENWLKRRYATHASATRSAHASVAAGGNSANYLREHRKKQKAGIRNSNLLRY